MIIILDSQVLGICNAGLVNGLSEELLLSNFLKYGAIDKILMIPGKSCCFVQFKNLNSAIQAYENINGKLRIAQDNKPLYLSYVANMPTASNQNKEATPPGLILLKDFITKEEEISLLNLCKFESNDKNAGSLKNRQVKHFGFEFRYDINNVDKDSPLEEGVPLECDFLWKKLLEEHEINFQPDQLTVNYYQPGHGIPSHVDTHSAFEGEIVSLSLGSGVVMDFKSENGEHIPIYLPQRSLVLMIGECRYAWTHGITPRKMDTVPSENGLTVVHRGTRTSFTFRKVRRGKCDCRYWNKCDSYQRLKDEIDIGDEVARKLETTHVHSVYEKIAGHFSETRHKPWPNVMNFVASLDVGSILVDVGCGNGKYLGHHGKIYEVNLIFSCIITN